MDSWIIYLCSWAVWWILIGYSCCKAMVRHNPWTGWGSDGACTSLAALGIQKTIAGLSIKCLRSGTLPLESLWYCPLDEKLTRYLLHDRNIAWLQTSYIGWVFPEYMLHNGKMHFCFVDKLDVINKIYRLITCFQTLFISTMSIVKFSVT